MFERAIVPLDGSPVAASALPWARRLPARSLHLLRVESEMPAIVGSLTPGDALAIRERAGDEAEAALALAAAAFPAGTPVTTEVRFGDDPAAIIIDEAGRGDVIVMTTHGRGAVGRVMFGSVADRVARHAVTPVLIARPELAAVEPARVVVPVDGSPRAEDAIPAAAAIARDLGLPLVLLRIVDLTEILRDIRVDHPTIDATTDESVWDDSRRDVEAAANRHLSALASPLEASGLRVLTRVATGSPAQGILDAVESTDLIVMTSHGRAGLSRWLIGSVADKLIREAPAPVLLVRSA